MNPKIAFFDTKPYDKEFFSRTNRECGFHITFLENHLTSETVPLTKGFNIICVLVNDFLDGHIVGELLRNGIELIALRSAGYNHVDLKAVFGKIHVVRVPAYSPHAVAEHAVALMLGLNRKTHRAYYRVRDNNFSINGLMGFDMCKKTAGIIGTGKIGRATIDIIKGFGMHILAYDVYPDLSYVKDKGFEYCNLDTLYSKADIISLHCPLTPENAHVVNRDAIGKMKDGVMIINTGRGKLIDTQDLIDGLKTGKMEKTAGCQFQPLPI
ncbi:MAG: 2-hydroxyacid dehydrogenase [Anaerolineales bacterium]|nr:2-hydroxyacid dehydrogenase [Anaerolineales bacterium]